MFCKLMWRKTKLWFPKKKKKERSRELEKKEGNINLHYSLSGLTMYWTRNKFLFRKKTKTKTKTRMHIFNLLLERFSQFFDCKIRADVQIIIAWKRQLFRQTSVGLLAYCQYYKLMRRDNLCMFKFKAKTIGG